MMEQTGIAAPSFRIEHIFDVREKSVIVTGGASGIGLAISRAFAENGAKVTIIDVNAGAIAACKVLLGDNARGIVADVVDRQALDAIFDEVNASEGGIDVVFANAGIGGGAGFELLSGVGNPSGSIDDPSDGDWAPVLAINLLGVRNTIGAAARVMKENGRGGRIVTTSSAAAVAHATFVSTSYHAAKAAVAHLTQHAALELAPHGILVNAIAPANFITNIGDGGMENNEVKALFANTSPLGRAAEPAEIVGLVLFLGSEASSYVTGTHILVDGGATIAVAPR